MRPRTDRTMEQLEHKGFTLWFTGLSGAGKSTVSEILEKRFRDGGAKVEVLDKSLCKKLPTYCTQPG